MRSDVAEALSFLKAHLRPGDIVLAERQTMLFIELTTGRAPARVADTISRIEFEELDLYHVHIDYGFFLDTRQRIDASIESLLRHLGARDKSKVWIVSIGWQKIRDAIGREIYDSQMTDAWSQGGASVYGFRTSAFISGVSGDPVGPLRSGTAGNGTPH
jgi:hypothetical protein